MPASARTLNDLPISLTLYETIARGNGIIGNIKSQIGATWQHSTRSIGGYWMATANYAGTRDEILEMFAEGMVREVRESTGGLITWAGFIAEMKLTLDGVTYERQWGRMANAIKAIYSRIGDNQLTNGSAESAAWTAYNTPTTNEQSTTWVSDGTYSAHLVSNSANDGATIQSGITIVAEKVYDCRCTVNVISGTWVLEVYRTDTGAPLATATENTAGQRVMSCSIEDTNTYASTIGVRIYETTGTGEIYADGAVFQEGPIQAETAWDTDEDSIDEYGRMEDILLLAGQSDEDANDIVATDRRKRAWPRALPPNEYESQEIEAGNDKLEITFYGHIFTARNIYTSTTGTDTRSAHITDLIGQTEFLSAGIIETNSRDYQIDDQAPIRIWEVLRDITLAGDASGNRWICGVFGDRAFDYRQADTTISYHYRGGRLLHPAGGDMEPWFALPGLAYVDDMPLGPGDITGDDADDPHVVFFEEVEFSAADWLAGGSGLKYRREVSGE